MLFSDKTDFAGELGVIASSAGFRTIVAQTSPFGTELHELDETLLAPYELVILVRGEHFSHFGNDAFYAAVQRFVGRGGKLLATSWVGWETVGHPFASVLPFEHVRDTYTEDVVIRCRPTAHEVATRLLSGPTSFPTSFELMRAKEDSVTLLESACISGWVAGQRAWKGFGPPCAPPAPRRALRGVPRRHRPLRVPKNTSGIAL